MVVGLLAFFLQCCQGLFEILGAALFALRRAGQVRCVLRFAFRLYRFGRGQRLVNRLETGAFVTDRLLGVGEQGAKGVQALDTKRLVI